MTTETTLRKYNLVATHITTNTDLLLQEWLVEILLQDGPALNGPDDGMPFTLHVMSLSFRDPDFYDPSVSLCGDKHSDFSISFVCHPEAFEGIRDKLRGQAEEDLDAHVEIVS